jgi:hypothetical protein
MANEEIVFYGQFGAYTAKDLADLATVNRYMEKEIEAEQGDGTYFCGSCSAHVPIEQYREHSAACHQK